MIHYAQTFREHFSYFSQNQNLEPGFQIFHIPVPENVFWGLGTFWHVQKIIDLFTILKMLCEVGVIRDKS